jgi:hypothetical protein
MKTKHGNKVYEDCHLQKYRLHSTNEVVKDDNSNLLCPKCNKPPCPNGEDSCLGHLKNVIYACCGHGIPNTRYVKLDTGECFYGDNIDLDQYK